MSFIDDFKKEISDAFPIRSGTNIDLGDYGYWEDNAWHYLGNIKESFGNRTFTEKERDLNQKVSLSRGVEVVTETGALVESGGKEDMAFTFTFQSAGALYFQAKLTTEVYFPSLEGEIKPYLSQLYDNQHWDASYWVAVSLLKSSGYLFLHSSASNVKASISCKANMAELDEVLDAQAKVGFRCLGKDNKVSSLMSDGVGEHLVGVKFVQLKLGKLSKLWNPERRIRYTGEGYTNAELEEGEEFSYNI